MTRTVRTYASVHMPRSLRDRLHAARARAAVDHGVHWPRLSAMVAEAARAAAQAQWRPTAVPALDTTEPRVSVHFTPQHYECLRILRNLLAIDGIAVPSLAALVAAIFPDTNPDTNP